MRTEELSGKRLPSPSGRVVVGRARAHRGGIRPKIGCGRSDGRANRRVGRHDGTRGETWAAAVGRLRRAPVALVALTLGLGCASTEDRPPDPTAPLSFDLTLRVEAATERVVAEAKLGPLDGPLTIGFAEQYSFARVEPRLVGPLEARAEGGAPLSVVPLDAYRWRIEPGDAVSCALTWTVRLDHRELPEVVAATDQYEQPYVAEDHGLLVTGAIVPVPERASIAPRVRLQLPAGWDAIVPWPEVEPGVWTPDASDLRDDLVAIGSWTRLEGSADGLDFTIAFAPGQERLTQIVEDRIPPIIEAEIEVFGGAPQPRYAFVFGRPDGGTGYGGSPKANAMALFVSPDLPLDFVEQGVTHLIAHEYFHTWMKERCRPEDELRFVVEGFTDYYAYLVPWRLGLTDDDDFTETLQAKLAEAESALARYGDALARAGGPEFFAGGDAYQACYSCGLALALWTDLALRRRGGDLDDLMRRFYGDPRWSPERRPTLDDWEALLAEALDPELARAHVAAVRDPDGIDWAALFARIGVRLERDVAPLDSGPRASFDGTTVRTLDPAGAGAVSGLRAGDRIVRVNGVEVGDSQAIRGAWDSMPGGRLRLTLVRGDERMEIDVDEPTAPQYGVPSSVIEVLAASTD